MKATALGLSFFIGAGLLPCMAEEASQSPGPDADSSSLPAEQATSSPSAPQAFSINALSEIQSPLAVDGKLDIGTAPALIPFMVEYPSFGQGHRVIVQMAGVNSYATPLQITATTQPLTFTIPKTLITPNYGKPVSITYTVEVPGAPLQTSPPLIVDVMLEELPPPQSSSFVNGKMDIGKAPLQMPFTVTYPSLSAGHRVTLVVDSAPPYKTPAQATYGASPLTFNVPRDALAKGFGKPLNIFYTVEIPGVPAQDSEPVAVQLEVGNFPPPETPSVNGADVAYNLNDRYADITQACSGNTPAYYCSGVMIRGTQNGNFDPWNPSTPAAGLGGVSFSYLRKDAYVKDVYRNSGFILLPQQEAMSKNKALEYLCVYAYDAWTALPQRPDSGCGLQPKGNTPDPSTCSQVNATTETGWSAFTNTLNKQQDQCSLSAQDASQFATSLKVRVNRPSNMPDAWNEVILKAWDQNVPDQLPLQAFFYKNATGLGEARVYQQKYAARTGNWLPIVKLDLTQLDESPFSYSPTDQWIQP